MRVLLAGLLACGLVACGTDGTAVQTGPSRPSTNADDVVLYLTAPAKYETLGLVSATSGKHGDDEGKMKDAVEKLKEEAADLGANGIVIQQTGQTSAGQVGTVLPVGNIGLFVSNEKHRESINGTAIYVEGVEASPAAVTSNSASASDASPVAPQPDPTAVSAAAEEGDIASQHELGEMYAEGTGVPQDYEAAAKWLILAKSRSATNTDIYRESAKHLHDVESLMTPADIAQAQKDAAAWVKAHPKRKAQ